MGFKLSSMCLLPAVLVWARSRAWLNPCTGQQSSFSLHFSFQAWHSCLQLAMCRWQHLPTLLFSSEPSGDGREQLSGLEKGGLQKRKLAVWAGKGSAGSWWVLVRSSALGPCLWAIRLEMGNFPFPETAFLSVGVPSESHCFSQWKICVRALQTVFAYLRFALFY